MFVLKSTHERILETERTSHKAVVSALEARIADLSRLVFVQTPSRSEEHPLRVANAILDGVEVMPKVDPEQEAAELAEANRILSGEYSNTEESW